MSAQESAKSCGGEAQIDELLARADTARIEGRYDEAVPDYRKVLELDPDNVQAHVGLGLIYSFGWSGYTEGDPFEAAIVELQRAVQLQPDNIQFRIYLAKAYQQIGMYEESKAEFEKVLELEPGNAEAQKQIQFLKEFGF